jgi:Tfp pilus assembly protein PilE
VTARDAGRARGLTLVEFLIAAAISAVVLLGVAGMFPAAFKSVSAGGHASKATAIAALAVEAIRLERFDDLLTRYHNFDTRDAIAGYACPVPAPATQGQHETYVKMRLKCEVAPDGVTRGLPEGYLRIGVACLNANGSVNVAAPCPTDLRRITVTVVWERNPQRSIQLTSHAARWY